MTSERKREQTEHDLECFYNEAWYFLKKEYGEREVKRFWPHSTIWCLYKAEVKRFIAQLTERTKGDAPSLTEVERHVMKKEEIDRVQKIFDSLHERLRSFTSLHAFRRIDASVFLRVVSKITWSQFGIFKLPVRMGSKRKVIETDDEKMMIRKAKRVVTFK